MSLLADRRRAAAPRKLLSKLRAAVSRQSWASSPLTINAYYSAVMNKIILPLGILQQPFYSADRPEVSQMICYLPSICLKLRLFAGAQLRRYRLLCRPRALARIRRQRAEVQRARRPGAVVERGHSAALRRAHGVPGAAVRRHARGGPQCQREVWPGYGSNAARPASTPRTHQIDARHASCDVTTFRGLQYLEKEPTGAFSLLKVPTRDFTFHEYVMSILTLL